MQGVCSFSAVVSWIQKVSFGKMKLNESKSMTCGYPKIWLLRRVSQNVVSAAIERNWESCIAADRHSFSLFEFDDYFKSKIVRRLSVKFREKCKPREIFNLTSTKSGFRWTVRTINCHMLELFPRVLKVSVSKA